MARNRTDADAAPVVEAPWPPLPADPAERAALADFLATHVTARRRRRMEEVLAQRTRWIAVVLEDLYQAHNASAVLRSCECFGVQDVHIVEDRHEFAVSRTVALGAAQWLDLTRHRSAEGRTIATCCRDLRQRGYRLLAATPHPGAVEDVAELDVRPSPVAVLFGTELTGLSAAALALADGGVRIPIYGFTESFNISVSAALVLSELTRKVRAAGVPWELSQGEKLDLRLRWLVRTLRHSDDLITRFAEGRGSAPEGI